MILIGLLEAMSLLLKAKEYVVRVGPFLPLKLFKVLTVFTEMLKLFFHNSNSLIALFHMEIMAVMGVKWNTLLTTSKTMVFQLKNNTLMWGDSNNVKKIMEIIK